MIARTEVHVWDATLEGVDGAARALLTPEEVERAARFRVEDARARFCAGRGLLRRLLAHYLGHAPQAVRLALGPQGKPMLDGPSAPLRFNLSHSGDRLLVALALGREVGVDIERVRPRADLLSIARRYFSAADVKALLVLTEPERAAAFASLWTRKEALLKCRGEGIGSGLGRSEQEFLPITVRSLVAAPGYACAVAAEGDDWAILRRDWPPPVLPPTP